MFYKIRATRHRTQALRNALPENLKAKLQFLVGGPVFSFLGFRILVPLTLIIVRLA